MTSRSSAWSNRPFLLSPAGKDYLWGGRRLKDDYSKSLDITPLAETWECSTHPDGVSTVASGKLKGMALKEALRAHPEYLGKYRNPDGELPVLVKLIDARQDLSVQVHPDDEYAARNENGARGKTEMWYVLDAAKGAKLIYGLHHSVNRAAFRASLTDGTVGKYLRRMDVRKGDVFCIIPGQVHAVGAGVLLVEVQENSNITYRLYDYDRLDKNGRPRELHLDKGLDVANLEANVEPRQPMRVLRYARGCASELLFRCKYFQVERQLLNTERVRAMADVPIREDSFQILLCTEGCGALLTTCGDAIHYFRGDCVFVPADSVPIKLHGKAEFLRIGC